MNKLIGMLFAGILLLGPSALIGDAAPAAAQPVSPNLVTVQVLSVDPTSPASSTKPQPLTFVLAVTNTTQEPLDGLTITAERGDPITSQSYLDAAISSPQPPTPDLAGTVLKPDSAPITVSLTAGQSETVTIRTDSDISSDAGLCICLDAIYPIYFSVVQQATDGSTATVGTAQTYLPVFTAAPRKVQVGWLWPLLERPHRLSSDTVFLDDQLAQSVGAGGRLSQLLEVAEAVGKTVPMTLVIDPELIDELQVMTTGYQVREPNGKLATGTGGPAAGAWLSRLRNLLSAAPNLELDLTPYADPDVDALVRNGLSWSVTMPAAMQARVETALGGQLPPSHIAWPVNSHLAQSSLVALIQNGTTAVALSGQSVAAPGDPTQPDQGQDSFVSLPTTAGTATAALLSQSINRYVGPALSSGGDGLKVLPQLVSEVAIHAIEPTAAQYVLLAPPPDLNPDPATAITAITAVSDTAWSTAVPLRSALAVAPAPADTTLLATAAPDTAILQTVGVVQSIDDALPGLRSMFTPVDAQALLESIPTAVQRMVSASWTTDPGALAVAVAEVQRQLSNLQNGVHLVQPTNGSYTLGSSDSPLPITIDNTLGVTVSVRVEVGSVGNVSGFRADDIGIQKISPLGKLQVHVPVHVDRAGRFDVQVNLYAPFVPDSTSQAIRLQLGPSVEVSVRSTALGEIGKVITILAGAVLALALLVRVIRRIRSGRSSTEPLDPAVKAELLSGDVK